MPFDWIRTPIPTLSELLASDFEDFLLGENLRLSRADPPVLRDARHRIVLPHDVDTFVKGGEEALREYFSPRIQALRAVLGSSNTIVLVRRRISAESASELVEQLRGWYPRPRFKLLAFNDRDGIRERSLRTFGNVILCELPRTTTKWKGDDADWDWALDAAMEAIDPRVDSSPSVLHSCARAVLGLDWVRLDGAVCALRGRTASLLELMPSVLVDALIAGEDHRFWRHRGVDYLAIVRALLGILTRRSLGGGSTIEQQLYRTLTGRHERTIGRKLRELVGARLLGAIVPKEDVPGLYLAVAYFGTGMEGLERAIASLGLSIDALDEHAAAAIVARLKYPQPRNALPERVALIERRARYIEDRLRRRQGRQFVGVMANPSQGRAAAAGPSGASEIDLADSRSEGCAA